jgi:8-oxo-dGTP pyrophosphatase MutT (NUDIX family)
MDRIFPQSGVIPFRGTLQHLEILLVTSRSNKRWIIPKGLIEPGLSPQDSALQEAYEEAGIRGHIVGEELGHYQYRKWGGICVVTVYPMNVSEILKSWPESSMRSRKWFKLENCLNKIREKDLRNLIETLPAYLKNQKETT